MAFIFGEGTDVPSYEALKKKREIADLLAQQAHGQTPKNVGEGIAAIGKAIAARYLDKKIKPQEDAHRKEIWDKLMGMSGGFSGAGGYSGDPATSPTSGATPEVTPSLGGASTIDMIKSHVFPGENGGTGDYNTLFAHSQRPGGQFAGTNLVDMTVDEALAFADPKGNYGQFVAGQNNGTVATPLGAFQVVGSTLRAAKEGLGLTGQEKFDEKTQDRVAEWIYKTQGPGAWEAWGPGGKFMQGGASGIPGPSGSGPNMAQIVQIAQLLSDPYAAEDPGIKMVAQAMIQQALGQQMTPYQSAQIGLEMQKLEQAGQMTPYQEQSLELERQRLEAEQNAPPDPFTLSPGQVRYGPDGQPLASVPDAPPDPYTLGPGQQRYGPDGQVIAENPNAPASAANVTTNVINPGDNTLMKKLNEKEGEVWSEYAEAGATAAAANADMEMLGELTGMAPQGPIQGRLASAFPGFSNAGAAFESIVKRVAPTLRVTGSGSTSDLEYQGMLDSLPALRNKPEANALIVEMMKAKQQINVARAEIVRQFANGEVDAKAAREQMRKLEEQSIMTPQMRMMMEGLAGGGGTVIDGYTIEPIN